MILSVRQTGTRIFFNAVTLSEACLKHTEVQKRRDQVLLPKCCHKQSWTWISSSSISGFYNLQFSYAGCFFIRHFKEVITLTIPNYVSFSRWLFMSVKIYISLTTGKFPHSYDHRFRTYQWCFMWRGTVSTGHTHNTAHTIISPISQIQGIY